MERRKRYSTDVSDEEWGFAAPYLVPMNERAPRRHNVLTGLHFLVFVRLMLPKELPWLAGG